MPASDAAVARKRESSWRFTTTRVADDRLAGSLFTAGTRYTGDVDSAWPGTLLSWVIPLVALFFVWTLVLRRSDALQQCSRAAGWAKINAHVLVQGETGIVFHDIAGIDEATAELRQIVAFLRDVGRYRRPGGRILTGPQIVGAPGTGKTLLAKAVAGEAGVPLFSVSGAGFVEMSVGLGAARVRDLFEQARAQAPCFVFIDELDALVKVRGAGRMSSNDEREQTLQ
ncbi:AAA family ATPase [Paraburkholderia graminis]|uniref:AAA family ATPase n=1 Tax=Paraburkholderia graminis TaxID=60548 RepID=UPI0038B7BBEA